MRPLCVALICSFLGACYSSYVAPLPSAPLLRKRNDVSVEGAVRASGFQRGSYLAGAWAPTDHWRVAASATYADVRGNASTGLYDQRTLHQSAAARQLDAALGYSFGFRFLQFEAFAGAGYGRARSANCHESRGWEDRDCESWVDSRATFWRPYGQIHVGIIKRQVEAAVGVRTSLNRFAFQEVQGQPSQLVGWVPALDPFIVGRAGWKWVKFQATFMWPIVAFSPRRDHEPLIRQPLPQITLGAHFSWQKLWLER
jgi:hypothetical protein